MDIDREKEGKCLTVTVPCYNSESYLERCVESLLKERDGLEIILVDDGSTDRTGQLADQYARAYPDVVRVVHKKNGGHGSGVNAGLMLANGIYFKVVDSDDWLDEAAFLVPDKGGKTPRPGCLQLCIRSSGRGKNESSPLRKSFSRAKNLQVGRNRLFFAGTVSCHACADFSDGSAV